jgi:gelsolin
MLKPTKIRIEDTNMALFGSPLEKEIKKHAAEGEPAWQTAGRHPGLEAWRVEKFQIKEWPKEKQAELFDGDSFIFLNTYEVDKVLKWNVHFWLGKYTSQDEAGTAAYKTVELDDFLGGTPVQYREVQGFESDAFLSLFPHGIKVQKGGVASGFRKVTDVEYEPRLLHVKGKMNKTIARRVPLKVSSLNEGDVFLLDLGKVLYQFNGKQAGIGEKSKASQLTRSIDDERGSTVTVHVVQTADADDGFWAALGGKGPVKSAEEGGSDADLAQKKTLWKLSDETGTLQFFAVDCKKSSLEDDEVFIYDCIDIVWVWVGKKASPMEKKTGLTNAQDYLNKNHPDRAACTPIVRILEGAENETFETYWH